MQKPAARLLRVALLMILYKLMFGDEEPRPDQVLTMFCLHEAEAFLIVLAPCSRLT